MSSLTKSIFFTCLLLLVVTFNTDNNNYGDSITDLDKVLQGYFKTSIGEAQTGNLSLCYTEDEANLTLLLIKDCAEMNQARIPFSVIAETIIGFYEYNLTDFTKNCLESNELLNQSLTSLGVQGKNKSELLADFENWEQVESGVATDVIIKEFNHHDYVSVGKTVANVIYSAVNAE